jgi:hypothetical protein
MALLAALAAGPVLLDGGLATQLEAAGADLSDELWSARLLADDPDAIVAAHRAYARAGAQVLTTASYQATVSGLARRGHDGAALLGPVSPWPGPSLSPIIHRGRRLGRAVRAALADGSEYRGTTG